MKAAVCDRYGTPDVVRIEDVERPTPGEGQILVRVRAASVNRADLDGIQPRPAFVRLFVGLRAPRNHSVGIDVAGDVEAVGPGVRRFKPGDAVFSDLFGNAHGAFAEYTVAPESKFEPIADGMSFEDAAALPHSAVLAVQGLRRRDGRTIRSGDKVLIVGASGNVGPFAVQIAKWLGAEVTGVASGAKLEFVRSLGADQVMDYRATDWTATGERYDWIVDTDSHVPIWRARRALAKGGTYVTLGGTAWPILGALIVGPLLSLRSDRWSGLLLWWKPFHRPDVDRLKELYAQRAFRPRIDRRYPLDHVAEALNWVNDGKAQGKVIVTVVPEAAEAAAT
ncbi:MAG TPA: NAD(P)-dependent alcohol dehydrogenase [Candidatus Limnocylindrales bacterium]|nr:NAD(P)-dependent alcohol dehydrogenase [Candidatus Limnocylindrales bacterium]